MPAMQIATKIATKIAMQIIGVLPRLSIGAIGCGFPRSLCRHRSASAAQLVKPLLGTACGREAKP